MSSGKLELTWHKSSNRWKKMVDGQVHYFGSGRSKSDRQGYKAALAKYRQFMEQRGQEQLRPRIRIASSKAPPADLLTLTHDPTVANALDKLRKLGVDVSSLAPPQDEPTESTKPTAGEAEHDDEPPVTVDAQGAKRGGENIADLVQAYLDEQKHRHDITKAQPEALPKKLRLNKKSYISLHSTLTQFKTWAEAECRYKRFGDSDRTERILASYRKSLEDLMLAGKMSAQTVSNRVRALRPFIKWLWSNRHIDDLPRNLEQVCQQYGAAKKAKSIDTKTIKRIWKLADERMKTLVAVALNCGFYSSELASIRVRDYKNGYIAKRRGKTGVASKHKLWQVTKALIKRQKDGKHPDDFLFVTNKGYPLVHEASNSITDSIQQSFRKFKRTHPTISVQWSHFRDTSATHIENIGKRRGDTTLVSQFLAHADGRTAAFYIDASTSPHNLESTQLDSALDELEQIYKLPLPQNKDKKVKTR